MTSLLTLDGHLAVNAHRNPRGLAVVDGDVRLDYATLEREVGRAAGAFHARGLRPGDRVAVLGTPSWRQVVLLAAAARGGLVFVGLNTRQSADELGFVLADSTPAMIFADNVHYAAACGVRNAFELENDFDALLAGSPGRVEQVSTGELAWVLVYTSGSTGRRKGAVLTQNGVLTAFRDLAANVEGPIICVNDLPIDHMGGLFERVLPPLITGGTTILHPRFDPERLLADTIAHRVNVLQGEVTQWIKLTALPSFAAAELSPVQVAIYTGAAAPPPLLETLCTRFPQVITAWGMTELSGAVTWARMTPNTEPGIVGDPIAGVDICTVDQAGAPLPHGQAGELLVRGPTTMLEYRGHPEATAQTIDRDGWVHTGDIGLIRDDGQVQLLGRNSDMIKSGGLNLWPREVEDILHDRPDVRHAAVVGVPDPVLVEAVAAYIVPADSHTIDSTSLQDQLREQLDRYKVPRHIIVVDELPLLQNGKVDKTQLRARFLPVGPS